MRQVIQKRVHVLATLNKLYLKSLPGFPFEIFKKIHNKNKKYIIKTKHKGIED